MVLEGDSELRISSIDRHVFNDAISHIAGERILYLADATINIVGRSLCEHFHRCIRQVADKAGQAIAIGYVVSGEAKAHALHVTRKNYMFGNLAHF